MKNYKILNAETRLCNKCNVDYEVRIFSDLPNEVQRSIIDKEGLQDPEDIVHFIEFEEYFYYCQSCGSVLKKNGK